MKEQIIDYGYDYILDNHKKIARYISQLLDITKVHLELIIKYDIINNKEAMDLPSEFTLIKIEPQLEKIVNADHKLEEQLNVEQIELNKKLLPGL